MGRGVSATKEDVHNAIKNIDKGLYPKAFCKIIPDILGGDADWCNIMHADGAGTKSSLAYAYCGSHRRHPALVDHRAQQTSYSRVGNRCHNQFHRGSAGQAAEPWRGHLQHGRRNGRCGRPGAHHNSRQHCNLPYAAQKRHRQCQYPPGRRDCGSGKLWAGHLRGGIQRWHGQQRPYICAP